MPKYALIKNNVVQDLRVYDTQPDDIPHKNIRWLPYFDNRPEYDPETQNIEKPQVVILEDRVEQQWTIVNKTEVDLQKEEDLKVNTVIESIPDPILNILTDYENRLRALESEKGGDPVDLISITDLQDNMIEVVKETTK